MLLLYLYVDVHPNVCLWYSKYFALLICVTFSFRVTLRREKTSTTVGADAAMNANDDVRQQSAQCDHVTSAMTSHDSVQCDQVTSAMTSTCQVYVTVT